MARKLNFAAPEPVLVEITADFVASAKAEKEYHQLLSSSLGWNCGTVSLGTDLKPWISDKRTAHIKPELLESLLAFDALVQNTDRTRENPNLFWRGKSVYPIDHERCFGYVNVYADKNRPWRKVFGQVPWEVHCLWNCVDRDNRLFAQDLYDLLEETPFDDIEALAKQIPVSELCKGFDLQPVVNFLQSLWKDKEDFFESLAAILAP